MAVQFLHVQKRPDPPAERIADTLDRIHAVLASINEKLDQLVKARS
jgi:hypothetical protein